MHPTPQPKRRLTKGQKWLIAAAVLVVLGLIGGIMEYFGATPEDPTPASEASPPPPEEEPTAEVDEIEQAREELGYPPELTGADRDAYLEAIENVDPGFRFPNDDSLIARAGDLCVELRDGGEEAALTRSEMIWVHEDHDYGSRPTTPEEAEALLDVVREHSCPDW
ncbi:DUF732 domain-containing protein [Nocardiopsis sp. NPDC049922]|uniref:DUF732 domain-containing protein n=1 Tax=Nocardiopsis sp. NPDC049922 TaxID=3155157 RepID=UPI0034067A35